MKLTEIYSEMLDEDYPSSFSMDEFKKLNSFNKRVKYCEANLKRISSGSSRIVYLIDDDKVLKLAKNTKGVAQCDVEIEYGNYYDISDIVAKTFDSHPDGLWVEMELARKLTSSDFKRITGFNFKDFGQAVLYHAHVANGRGNNPHFKPKDYDNMWEEEFSSSIFNFIGGYGISKAGDLARFNSYGVVDRDGDDTIVIIDYGLTDDVYDSYYS